MPLPADTSLLVNLQPLSDNILEASKINNKKKRFNIFISLSGITAVTKNLEEIATIIRKHNHHH